MSQTCVPSPNTATASHIGVILVSAQSLPNDVSWFHNRSSRTLIRCLLRLTSAGFFHLLGPIFAPESLHRCILFQKSESGAQKCEKDEQSTRASWNDFRIAGPQLAILASTCSGYRRVSPTSESTMKQLTSLYSIEISWKMLKRTKKHNNWNHVCQTLHKYRECTEQHKAPVILTWIAAGEHRLVYAL